MSSRTLVLAFIAVAAAACGDTTGPDFEGIYEVRVIGTSEGAFPRVHWPDTLAVVLALDEMDQPHLTLAGLAPRALEFKRSAGALDVRTLGPFPLELVDRGDCDFPLSWTGDESAIVSYHFEDNRVTAHTSGIAYCQRRPGADPDTFIARFQFDLDGGRSPEAR